MTRLTTIVAGMVCAMCVVIQAQAGFAGKWQGQTGTGRPLVLETTVKGKTLSGTLRVGPQTAPLTEAKADDKTVSFTITIEDRTVACTARLLDADSIELTVQDVQDPVTLKRVKDAR